MLSYSLFSLPSPLAIFFPIFQPASSISTCQHAPSLPTRPDTSQDRQFYYVLNFLSIGSAYLRNDQKFERLRPGVLVDTPRSSLPTLYFASIDLEQQSYIYSIAELAIRGT